MMMRKSTGLGVLSVVLLMVVATALSPLAIASVGLLDEANSEDVSGMGIRTPDDLSESWLGGDPPGPLVTPPVIMGCSALPPVQQVGNAVNISCMIFDDVSVVSAWVEVTDPDGQVVGNFSMLYDPISMQWYNETIYLKAGIHSYTVTAWDFEGQSTHSDDPGQTFLMQDLNDPTVSNEAAAPDPQEIGQNVNITCDVTDDGLIDEVWVEIWDPSMVSLGNFSMSYNSVSGNWYFEQAYFDVGTHTFQITAWDTGGNFDVASGTFVMEDTTLPSITDPREVPNPQEVLLNVNISAVITDLGGVDEVWLRVVDPSMAEVGNWSMTYDLVNGRYYDNRTYNVVGLYTYEIWAKDSNGNWASYFGTFTILPDVTPPVITGTTASPSPQEIFSNVNITTNVTDNIAVAEVWVEILNPLGVLVGNFSMTFDPGTGDYYYEQMYDMLGTYTFTIWAKDTGNWWSSDSGSFIIQDTTLPVIDQITAVPDPQEVFLAVNVSCRITDNVQVWAAWIEIRDVSGSLVGNFSMLFDVGTGRWSYEASYNMVGLYTFTIWANDTSDNWGTNTGSFTMRDTTPPIITGHAATPDPQESNSNVNITCTVTDNYLVSGVWVEVFDPLGTPMGNFTMLWDSVASQFYWDQSYWELGVWDYTIWANDTSDNWDTDVGTFTIQDTTNPVISDVQRIPQPQEVHFDVNVSAIVTDNYQVQEVLIDIVDPFSTPVGTFFMAYDVGSGRYFFHTTYDEIGTYTCTIWANDTMNNQDQVGCDFVMVDTTPPQISDLTEIPDPGEVNLPINVSCNVTDNYQVQEVWFDVRDPGGTPVGNFSMLYDSVRYYYTRSYALIGLYTFDIWAGDTVGLWATVQGAFFVRDTTPPTISAMTAVPDPQEVYGSVNISAQVIDNYALDFTKVEIRNPIGGLIGDFTMNLDPGTGRYYYEQAYSMLGIHFINLSAKDISNNWNSVFGTFLIQDTTPPTIQNTMAAPDPQDSGGNVKITATVSDNFLLDQVWIEVFDPFSASMFNTTMLYDVPNDEYYWDQAYVELGFYDFIITARDTSNNYAVDIGMFEIVDISPPTVGVPTATPDPQEVYGNVNVTVDVSDNYQIQRVDIDISDPLSGSVGNFSMIYDVGSGLYGYEQAYDMLGVYNCVIWALDTSNNPNSRLCSFRIQDTTSPAISAATALPSPQNIGGDVNVSALITDNFQLQWYKLKITDPDSLQLGNDTMNFDAGTGRYYLERQYFKVGTYDYEIYAEDSSGNKQIETGTFAIEDRENPWIRLTQAFPTPQEVYANVNISARISDNHSALLTPKVEVLDPIGGWVDNFTMNYHTGANKYFFLGPYGMLGTYTFTIWASDSNGNWASDSGSFDMVDTTAPSISVLTNSPQEIEVGAIAIDATITDNFYANSTLLAWINISNPDGSMFENVSMTYNAGDDDFKYSNTFNSVLGTYDFVIWAVDGEGIWKSASDSFVIQDTQLPVADAGTDQSVNQGDLVTFDGSGSSDNDPLFDTTGNYTWTFNELGAKTLYGVSPTYTFSIGGDYVVTLTVKDRAENEGTDTVSVHVIAGPREPTMNAVKDPTESSLNVSWNPPTTYTDGTTMPPSDIKGCDVYRADDAGGPYSKIASLVTDDYYVDTGLSNNTTYYYRVTCWSLGENIESEMSEYRAGSTTIVTPPPPPPPPNGDGEDGEEAAQDMMLYVLLSMLIIVIVVVAIIAAVLFKRKKKVEPEEEVPLEEEYWEDEELPPPPPE